VEGLQLYTFYGAGAQARFDRFSHILPSYQVGSPCAVYAKEPVEACDAHFGAAPAADPATRKSLDYLLGK
jgi:hypothetical protein